MDEPDDLLQQTYEPGGTLLKLFALAVMTTIAIVIGCAALAMP